MRQWFRSRAQHNPEPQTRGRRGVWADTIRADIRFGCRQMMRNPAFTLVAVATLALGIGANTAIFSVVNSILLKPLPFPDADRLVVPATIFSRQQSDRGSMSYPDLQDWRAQKDLFGAVAAINRTNADLTGGDEPERVRVLLVEQDYFTVMSARPARGRLFTAAEQVPQAPRAVILTWPMWMRRYGGDPGIVGRKIELSGAPAEVVGVLPEGAVWPEQVDLIASLRIGPNPTTADLTRRDNHMFRAVAKLQPGVSLETAQARLTVLGAQVAAEHKNRAGTNWKVHTLSGWIVGPALGVTIWVLFASVLMVLLIACVNVASLLLSRALAREREVSIRAALGAGKGRLIRQFLVESLLLSGAGAIAGVGLGIAGVRALVRFAPADIPNAMLVQVDLRVLAFVALLCVLTALIFGILPALHAAGHSPVEAIRGGRSSGGVGTTRVRGILVAAQLALAVMLLAGAGLLIRSLLRLQSADPGIPTQNLLTMQIGLPPARYSGPGQVVDAFESIAHSVKRIPGVSNAAAISSLPLGGGGSYLGRVFLREGQPEPPASADAQATWVVAQPETFATMGIRVTSGRGFTTSDTSESGKVIIISQSMAREMFPNSDPLGRRIRSWRDENLYREIVGVVSDVHQYGLASSRQNNNVYVPHTQSPWRGMVLAIRSAGEPAALLPSIRSAIWSHDSRLPLAEVRTMPEVVERELARPRFAAWLLGVFAATALVMAAVGIYGLIAYTVSLRTREIGIRLALGATRGSVLALVGLRVLWLCAAGIAAGLTGAFLAGRALQSILNGVRPGDAVSFAGATIVLIVSIVVATWIPARRAARVDPVVALREE